MRLRLAQSAISRIAFLTTVALAGCGRPGTSSPPADPLVTAWAAYERGDYFSAGGSFREALAAEPGRIDALNGLGWTLAHLDSLPEAVAQFTTCILAAPRLAEPEAGRAAAAAGLPDPDYALAIASADSALAISPRFQFRHEPDVDWQDLRLIIAQSAWATADYERCLAEVDSLQGNPPDPSQEDFVNALLTELERLADQLR